ncbi:lytic transglycosylase domain-containing protein [Glycocaulis profundi]|nr:lytic transglycosylase domain-containing protein [Glycocaulis profundi]
MDRLSLAAVLAALAAPAALHATESPAFPPLVERWRPHIAEASRCFGVPEDWIGRVMQAESGGRTRLHGRPITSRAGAMGLMQIMPATWAELRARHGFGSDPHDPRDNILAGAAYLREMHDRFGYPGLFAAYNAGPARYARHLRTGQPLPAETRAYLAILSATPPGVTMPPDPGTGRSLFFPLRTEPDRSPHPNPNRADELPRSLFAPIRGSGEGRD